MNERMELSGSAPHSARIEVDAIQTRREDAERLADRTAEVAIYAREVAESGSWHNQVDGWAGRPEALIGTQFLPIKGGDSVALRPKVRNRANGKAYLELLLKSERDEARVLAIIEDRLIELPIVGKPDFYELGNIRGLLDYIDAHDTK